MRVLVLVAVAVLTLAAIRFQPDARSRTDDGRVGTVVDRHGLAFVQPAGRSRWTPLARRTPLIAGDAVRTELRGANAVEIELSGGGHLLVGPDTRLEIGDRSVHLMRGECEVEPGGAAVQVTGPGGVAVRVDERKVLRATPTATETLQADPAWLSGYRESTTSEWMGSLVAKVDGRDVPLAIREHRVDVTIRDSIAETTIDQVYANATSSTLEGTFTFPLPPGASVSGFSMWIGNEQVEADIVERSRARQIYEDLKRRMVDPGLLEWSGGNLFTARVWPITAHGEKRIRVRYTQILPLEGTTMRWSTALRSEAMRAQPIRSVHVHAEVASSRKLAKVGSPSHEVSATGNERSATIDWDASEFTPDRDFELRLELAETTPLTIVDHVRDGSGYFAAMITPPDGTAGWHRVATPEGKAMELVLVCDTSGSMDTRARETQREVVAALLGSLSADDRFRVLGADYRTAWFEAGAVPADAPHVAAALAFLDTRPSLGWTDLDLAFRTALESAGRGATLVYVGDGMVTRGDADGAAFARRCATLLAGHDVTLSAVAVSNAIDSQVLDSITRAGHGSYVDVADDPAGAALAILGDALGPKLQDVRVSFEGIDVARVLPDVLQNVAVGRERIVVGRFLPSTKPQQGKVVIEGRLEGEPVRWTRDCTLGTGDPLHSYLPRLWVQRHIEKLISDGLSPESRAEIVGLSAQFQVMTPLTSFLVLESDADRERYGVTRQIKMRDGEAFFAAARDQARADRMRAALAEAARWRAGMRSNALLQISDLGRSEVLAAVSYAWTTPPRGGPVRLVAGRTRLDEATRDWSFMGAGAPGSEPSDRTASGADAADLESENLDRLGSLELLGDKLAFDGDDASKDDIPRADDLNLIPELQTGFFRKAAFHRRNRAPDANNQIDWYPDLSRPSLGTIGFPQLADWTGVRSEGPDPAWPNDLIAVLRSLDKRDAVRALDGVEIQRTQISQHAATGRVLSRARTTTLWSRDEFIVRAEPGTESATQVSMLLAGIRSELSVPLGLGRRRDAAPGEAAAFFASLPIGASNDLTRALRDHSIRLIADDGESLEIELRSPDSTGASIRISIDRKRAVLRTMVSFVGTRRIGSTTVEDLLEIDGIALPGRVVTRDDEGRILSVDTLTAKRVSKPDFTTSALALRLGEAGSLVLAAKDPLLSECREAEHSRTASTHQRLALLVDLLDRDRLPQAAALWATLRPQLGEVRAARWLGLTLAARARLGEEFLTAAHAAADALVEMPPVADTFFLVHHLMNLAAPVLGDNERFALNERLRSALALDKDDPEAKDRDIAWRLADAQLLNQLGDLYRARARLDSLADLMPWHLGVQTLAASWAQSAGNLERAAALYERAIAADSLWTRGELDALFRGLCELNWTSFDLTRVQAVAERWIASGSHSVDARAIRLAAMLYQDRSAEVLTEVDEAIEADFDLISDPVAAARLDAVLQFLLGNGYRFQRPSIQAEDLPRLSRLSDRLLQSPGGSARLMTILGTSAFRRTDAGRDLVAKLVGWLGNAARVEQMPFDHLDLALAQLDARSLSDTEWAELAANLQQRIGATDSLHERDQLTSRLTDACDRRGDKERAIAINRTRLGDSRDRPARQRIASTLLARLQAMPWSAEREDEMFGLCVLTLDPFAEARMREQAYTLVLRGTLDALVDLRNQHELGPVADLEKLARNERRARELAARPVVRRALATRTLAEVGKLDPALRVFATVEALGFVVETTEDRQSAREQIVAALDAIRDREADDVAILSARRRLSLELAHLSVRRGAESGLVNDVLATYTARAKTDPRELDWRSETARLLVATDRDDALLTALEDWIHPSRIESRWRTLRGWLLAARGEFASARKDLDRLAGEVELDAREWGVLAAWRLVTGDEEGAAAARRSRFDALDEWSLRNVVDAETVRLRAGPGTIETSVIDAARSLLAKAGNVQWMLHAVDSLYAASKDPRVAGALGSAALGRSPERAYQAIEALRTSVENLHEEAALDELAAELQRLGSKAITPTDRRSLSIATYLCESRASRVPGGNGDHRRRMISALQELARGVRGKLVSGERIALSQVLAGFGALPGEDERALRRSILELLRSGVQRGSLEDLSVSRYLAHADWSDGARDSALDTIDAALRRSEEDAGNAMPEQALPFVDVVVAWLCEIGRHGEAETRLERWRAKQPTPWRREDYEDRIDKVYSSAIELKGTTSLGSGAALFDSACTRMERRIATTAAGRSRTQALLGLYSSLCRVAFRAKAGDPVARLSEFASTELADVLTKCPTQHADFVYIVGDTLDDIGGTKAALALLVRHCLAPPSWNARIGLDLWSRFDWRISNMRPKAGDLGSALRSDLRALVLRELERDLVSVGQSSAPIWREGDSRFWRELRSDYVAVAGKVLELHPKEAQVVVYTARFLHDSLSDTRAAVRALRAFDESFHLGADHLAVLAAWLVELQEYEEAVPHFRTLVAVEPTKLAHHLGLITALGKTKRVADARTAFGAAIERFADSMLLSAETEASLAFAARDAGLFREALEHVANAVHTRERTRRPGTDSVLSDWYAVYADMLSCEGRDDEAVEAAGASIVCCPEDQNLRRRRFEQLEQVLARIQDLDTWIAAWDTKTAKSGTDAPIVRKALASVLRTKGAGTNAVTQLRIALALDPRDTSTYRELIAALDSLGKREEALIAVFAALTSTPGDLDLIVDLAARLTTLGREVDAERAWSDLVEHTPQEAAGHRRLAEQRVVQRRLPEAIEQWQQVVRTRPDDAEGYLSLATAQIAGQDRDGARATLETVMAREWGDGTEGIRRRAVALMR